MSQDTKVCVGCKDSVVVELFYASTQTEDGLNRYCIQCCKVNRGMEAVRKRDKKSKISVRQEQRAKGLNIHYETGIKLVHIFKRDRGICGLCKEWVAPRYASIDHVKPLSKGGEHTMNNVQLTHLKCNLRKGNRQ